MDGFACGTETRGLEEGFPRLCLLSGGGGGGGGGGGVGGVGGGIIGCRSGSLRMLLCGSEFDLSVLSSALPLRGAPALHPSMPLSSSSDSL